MDLLLINGPNLNLVGKREPNIYGAQTLEDIQRELSTLASQLGVELNFFQSNSEGDIIDCIQKSVGSIDGIIINAGAYTHTSIAIRDALEIFKKPIIELHISNIYKREEFRHKSLISDIATGGIFGLGVEGYILAIISIEKILKNEIK